MNNRIKKSSLYTVCACLLVVALLLTVSPVKVQAESEGVPVTFVIDDEAYSVDMQFKNQVLYCRADQWAAAAGCLSKRATDNSLIFYTAKPVIIARYEQDEFFAQADADWAPFFDVAKQTGVYFSEVSGERIAGHRAKPLAVFYDDMDRMFGVSRYRISELILELDEYWVVAGTAARSYAILSSGLISGFLEAVSGKMDADIYEDIFIDMLKTDETLLDAVTDLGDSLKKPGKVISILQKAMDEDGALIVLLEKMEFSESEIQEIILKYGQTVYGNDMLNDLSDLYEFEKAANLIKILKKLDHLAISIDADTNSVMAMQAVFSNMDSAPVQYALQKAVGARLGNEVLSAGLYTTEYVSEYFLDKGISAFEKALEKKMDVTSLDNLLSEIFLWVYDEAFSLSNKQDAILYTNAYSLVQLELASYYYDHRDDDVADNAVQMQAVALLYLRACLNAYKLYAFDTPDSHNDSVTETFGAEFKNLLSYTEEELLQNGTSEECAQAIEALVQSQIDAQLQSGNQPPQTQPPQTEPQQTEPLQTEPLQTEPLQTQPQDTQPTQSGAFLGQWNRYKIYEEYDSENHYITGIGLEENGEFFILTGWECSEPDFSILGRWRLHSWAGNLYYIELEGVSRSMEGYGEEVDGEPYEALISLEIQGDRANIQHHEGDYPDLFGDIFEYGFFWNITEDFTPPQTKPTGDRRLKQVNVYEDGRLYQNYTLEYGASGRLSGADFTEYVGDENYSARFTFTYDSDGRLLKADRDDFWLHFSNDEYAYDSAGCLVCHKNYWGGGELPYHQYECAYDGQGNLIAETHLGPNYDGDAMEAYAEYSYSYVYDADGRILEKHGFIVWNDDDPDYNVTTDYGTFPSTEYISVERYTYDAAGRVRSVYKADIPRSMYSPDGNPNAKWQSQYYYNYDFLPLVLIQNEEGEKVIQLWDSEGIEIWSQSLGNGPLVMDEQGYIQSTADSYGQYTYELTYEPIVG